MKEEHEIKFYKLMNSILKEYKKVKSNPPIREVDRFMKKIVDIYNELNEVK